jgi:redox-sensing transcriptional repressor
MQALPVKTIERMSRYRRELANLLEKGDTHIYSHQLAFLVNGTPAQVRRDFMLIGHSGSSRKGYEIKQLRDDIDILMDNPEGQKIAITGLGNLGRSILNYLTGRRTKLMVAAIFDIDPAKTNRVISGCRCYPIDQLEDVIRREGITIGIITTPASGAQEIVDRYVKAGIKSIVNWAPTLLHVPHGVFLETRDIMMSIEKAAFFAKGLHPKH